MTCEEVVNALNESMAKLIRTKTQLSLEIKFKDDIIIDLSSQLIRKFDIIEELQKQVSKLETYIKENTNEYHS